MCNSLVNTNPNLNAWFDPLSIFATITVSDICADQWNSFSSVKTDPQASSDVNKYLAESYLGSIKLNLGGQLAVDYLNCVNLDVIGAPN